MSVNLTSYTARGFRGNYDQGIAKVGVAGIDRDQAHAMLRLCEPTESVLYGPDWSPHRIRYTRGSRPQLEAIARQWDGLAPQARLQAALDWTYTHVQHPHLYGQTPPDRALSEEGLIDSGVGWCNEQHRVFLALMQVAEIPGRIVFLFHGEKPVGHAASDVLIDGRWVFVDVTFRVTVPLADGRLAEVRQISGDHRRRADAAYQVAFSDYYAKALPYVADLAAWGVANRPDVDRGGDLLHEIGITNYVIDGCTAV